MYKDCGIKTIALFWLRIKTVIPERTRLESKKKKKFNRKTEPRLNPRSKRQPFIVFVLQIRYLSPYARFLGEPIYDR